MPHRPSFEPCAPINVRDGYEPLASIEDSWTPKATRSKRRRLPIKGLLVSCLVGGAVLIAWQQATARDIPAELVSYVKDGVGVEFVSENGRYSAQFPRPPQHMNRSITFSGTALDVSFAYSRTGNQVIGVGWFDVPSRSIATKDANANLAQLANSYAVAEEATVTELDFFSFHGYGGVDAHLRSDRAVTKIRVVMVGTRIYVLHAGGTPQGAIGLGRLSESFELKGD